MAPNSFDTEDQLGGTEYVGGTPMLTCMREGATLAHMHVGGMRGAEDLSPRPGLAKATDWHRAADWGLGTPAVDHLDCCPRGYQYSGCPLPTD